MFIYKPTMGLIKAENLYITENFDKLVAVRPVGCRKKSKDKVALMMMTHAITDHLKVLGYNSPIWNMEYCAFAHTKSISVQLFIKGCLSIRGPMHAHLRLHNVSL